MNKFRSKAILLLLGLTLSVSHPALAKDQAVVENHGTIGAVDIGLSYEVEGNYGALLPGDTIALKSAVTNKAESAWLRVKIQYPIYKNEKVLEHLVEENLTELDDSLITFADEQWKKIGSYYYLLDSVGRGKTVKFTESIKFPTDWDNRLITSKFGIVITAEAIQEQNFEPDFDSDDPWHGAVIEAYDTTDYIHKGAGTERFSVRYEGGAEGLITTSKDFFANWETLMPGDVVDGTAAIENKMKIPVKLFFAINPVLRNTVRDEYLLSNLHLVVKHGDTKLYDGNLMDPLPELLLKEYAPGESAALTYELSVPTSLTNEYAEMDFSHIWIFRAVPNPPEEKEVIPTGEWPVITLMAGLCLIMVSSGLLMRKKGGKRA